MNSQRDQDWSLSKTLTIALIGYVVFIFCYLPYIADDFFPLDDFALTQISFLQAPLSWQSLVNIFTIGNHIDYYPIRDLSYLIDIHFLDNNPFYYRLHNFALVFAMGYLFFRILRGFNFERKISLFLVSLAIIHPMNAEVFSWISSRKGILSIFFFLLALRNFQLGRDIDKNCYFITSLIFYFCSLASKASLTILPISLSFLILIRHLPFELRRIEKMTIHAASVIAIFWGGLQAWFYKNINDMTEIYPFEYRIKGALISLGKYLHGFFDPRANILDPENWPPWLELNSIYLIPGTIAALTLIGLCIRAFLKTDKWTTFFIAIFAATFIPISSLTFPHRNFYAVRYFLPSLWVIFFFLSFILFHYRSKIASFRYTNHVGGLIIFLVFAQCYVEVKWWGDSPRVRKKAMMQSPQSDSLKAQFVTSVIRKKRINPSMDPELIREMEALYPQVAEKCQEIESRNSLATEGRFCWHLYHQAHHPQPEQEDVLRRDEAQKKVALSFANATPPPKMLYRLALKTGLEGNIDVKERIQKWDEVVSYYPDQAYRFYHWLSHCYLKDKNEAYAIISGYLNKDLIRKDNFYYELAKNIHPEVLQKLEGCYPKESSVN